MASIDTSSKYKTEGGWCDGPEHAQLYSQIRQGPPQAVIDFVIQHMRETRPGPNKLALDVGCGSGQATRMLAKYFDRVVGLEVSESQLEVARATPGTPENVSYTLIAAESGKCHYPFEDNSCDLITAVQACHWFELEPFFKEVERVLAPGGTLALIPYSLTLLEFPWRPDLTDQLTQCYIKKIYHDTKPYWRPEVFHIEAEYSDIVPPFRDQTYIRPGDAPPSFTRIMTTTMEGFRTNIKTWSGYRSYLAHQEPGTLERELMELTKELADIAGCSVEELEQREIRLKDRYFMRLGRKSC